MNTSIHICLFAVFVLFTTGMTMWDRAESWQGAPFRWRFIVGMSESWKWWFGYSVAFFLHDLMWQRNLQGGIVVVTMATLMALVFAYLRSKDARESAQRGKK